MSNHRFIKFWPQDWHGEPTLQMCSLAARGLWMEMLCLAHLGQPYGHLTINSGTTHDQLSIKQLAKYARSTVREVSGLLSELENNGVFSRTPQGVIFSRRMVEDGKKSDDGAKAASKRWGNDPPNGSPSKNPNTPYSEAEIIDQKQRQRSDARAPRDSFHQSVIQLIENQPNKFLRMKNRG